MKTYLLILAGDKSKTGDLQSELIRRGFECSLACLQDGVSQATGPAPDLLLIELNGHAPYPAILGLSQKLGLKKPRPVIALVSKERLASADFDLPAADDFIIEPCDADELVLRVKRLLAKANNTDSGNIIHCGDLIVDLDNCAVFVSGGEIELTFKEYELLKFLAGNPGHVFSREALLDRVWGYDYYGGDRTVDVHVRRLRSKIEDPTHSFIDTVRNIGYRFRRDL